jgi:outer membrane lipoprotein-sorting protein
MMMNRRILLCGLLALLAGAAGSRAQGKSDANLEQVLKQMESAGRGFQSFEAKLTQKKYTSVLEEFDAPETGTFAYARARDGSALLRQEILKPGVRILTINGGVATVYQPLIKRAQVVSLGKNKDKAEYLALGLGQSPARLRETFDISYLGSEAVGKIACSVIVLKPKSANAAAYFSSITLWVDKAGGIPVQQKLLEPNGDYLLVTFTEARLNRGIQGSFFEQKLPKDTEIQRMR